MNRFCLYGATVFTAFVATVADAAIVVKNGDFEVIVPDNGDPSDVPFWSNLPGVGAPHGVVQDLGGLDQAVNFFGIDSPSSISQSISGTEAGKNYVVSFFLANDLETDNFVRIYWEDMIDPVDTIPNIPVQAHKQYFVNVTSTVNNSVLRLEFQNDLGTFFLDDVTVTEGAVPEPASLILWSVTVLGSGLACRRKLVLASK